MQRNKNSCVILPTPKPDLRRTKSWKSQLIRASRASACDGDHKKEFDKNYKVNSDVELELATSFGDVTITNWDKNEVDIHVEVCA